MNTLWLEIYDSTTKRSFKKYFACEYDKRKFKNKLRFSKKLTVMKDSSDYELGG